MIFLAQLQHIQVPGLDGSHTWMSGAALWKLLCLIALTMGITQYLPKLTGAFPAPLAAIVSVTLLVIIFDIDTKSVGDLASIQGGLPGFNIPAVPFT